jgi:uncharacterized protein (TIGR03083 family)
MTTRTNDLLADIDPFDVFDQEATRLDRFFSSIGEADRDRPSRCDGWSVRDVLAHLAGEELYNHACLDDDVDGFGKLLRREDVSGFSEFNEWSVRQRRGVPYEEVLQEWRIKNGETRRRMRALGRDANLATSAGPYPVGSQTFHYDSEYATHADDVGAPVSAEEAAGRTEWRVRVGMFVLGEQGAAARVTREDGRILVNLSGTEAELSPADFVTATVGRLPGEHPLDRRIRAALRCLA